jgi:hypothetical protein
MARLMVDFLVDLMAAEALYVLKLTTWVRVHVGAREVT